MKKTIKYIFAFVIGCIAFTSCDDPYANQIVAEPGGYEQLTLQDTTGFVVAVKTGISPLTIKNTQLADSLSILTLTSVLNVADTAASVKYKIQLSNTADFASVKTIPVSYTGKVGTDVKVNFKNFNDTIKSYNKSAVQRTVNVRLIAYIVKAGLKTMYTSNKTSLLVTPYSYPPVALNDIATLPMNSSATIDVLANDTDPEADALTIASVTTPAHGTAAIASGKVLYTPTTGYSGADNFSYTVSDGNGNSVTANVDITVLAVNPYTSVTVRPWYIIGLANGGWNNSAAGLGVSIYPLSVVTGNKYNLAGDGEFTFTGYFQASRGFKLIRDLGNWDVQWGMSGSTYKYMDGGSGNITVPADGYYTITLNSITNNLSIVPVTVTPKSFTSMGMIGEMNGWGGDVAMTAAETSNNHIWYATYTFASDFTPPVGNGGCKFRANGGWTDNWGGGTFPVGIGTNGGTNIPFKAGTYKVIFNDLDGTFYFIK